MSSVWCASLLILPPCPHTYILANRTSFKKACIYWLPSEKIWALQILGRVWKQTDPPPPSNHDSNGGLDVEWPTWSLMIDFYSCETCGMKQFGSIRVLLITQRKEKGMVWFNQSSQLFITRKPGHEARILAAMIRISNYAQAGGWPTVGLATCLSWGQPKCQVRPWSNQRRDHKVVSLRLDVEPDAEVYSGNGTPGRHSPYRDGVPPSPSQGEHSIATCSDDEFLLFWKTWQNKSDTYACRKLSRLRFFFFVSFSNQPSFFVILFCCRFLPVRPRSSSSIRSTRIANWGRKIELSQKLHFTGLFIVPVRKSSRMKRIASRHILNLLLRAKLQQESEYSTRQAIRNPELETLANWVSLLGRRS